MALLATGCAGGGLTSKPSEVEAARQHLNTMLREVRAQEAALREEMARTRIAAAKQEADLKTLRAQIAELRQTLESRQAELRAVRTERDRLQQVKAEHETQLAELGRLRLTAAEAAAAQAKVRDLEAALATRTAEMEQLRKELGVRQARNQGKAAQAAKAKKPATEPAPPAVAPKAPPKTAALPPVQPAEVAAATPAEPPFQIANARSVQTGMTRVTVQAGDTLWGLAHQHGLSVDALKQANGLDGDVIVPGQELLIPAAADR